MAKPWFDRSTRIASGFDIIIVHEFDYLHRHCRFAESQLKQVLAELEERINRVRSEDDDEHKDEYLEVLYEEHHEMSELIPKLQWYSQFQVVYSVFEHCLNELANIVQRRSGYKASFKDFAGQGIRRTAAYLKKLAGVEAPFNTPEWNRAIFLGEIRNKIAHCNGEILYDPDDKGSLAGRLLKENNINLKQVVEGHPEAEIYLSAEFVKESISTLQKVVSLVANYELYSPEDES